MYENMTYEALVNRALARVNTSMDKREGSMVFNGVAPAMAELAQLYIEADFILKASRISTAPRTHLIEIAECRNLAPYPATAAVFRGEFDTEVEIGARFSCNILNYVVTARMSEEDSEGLLSYRLTCETVGVVGNSYAGTLIPIEYIDGLTHAELVELLVPGDDEEETEHFRRRVLNSFKTQAFGGNQTDYVEKVTAIPGVGAVKVHPVWNGNLRPAEFIPNDSVTGWYEANVDTLPAPVRDWLTAVHTAAKDKLLTVGGTVKLVILADDNAAPSEYLLNEIQTAIDPTQNAGEGLGLAPIGHVVHVTGVQMETIDFELHLTYAYGWDWAAAKSYVEAVIDSYLAELAQTWADSEFLTVRISQIESRILTECSTMIVDIEGTKISGIESNFVLGEDSIPVRGTVSG